MTPTLAESNGPAAPDYEALAEQVYAAVNRLKAARLGLGAAEKMRADAERSYARAEADVEEARAGVERAVRELAGAPAPPAPPPADPPAGTPVPPPSEEEEAGAARRRAGARKAAQAAREKRRKAEPAPVTVRQAIGPCPPGCDPEVWEKGIQEEEEKAGAAPPAITAPVEDRPPGPLFAGTLPAPGPSGPVIVDGLCEGDGQVEIVFRGPLGKSAAEAPDCPKCHRPTRASGTDPHAWLCDHCCLVGVPDRPAVDDGEAAHQCGVKLK
jgi:hypothetical protein